MSWRPVLASLPWMLGLCLARAQPVAAGPREVRVADRASLLRALNDAVEGTRLLLAPGTYEGGLRAVDLRGTRSQPIVIAAADPDDPPVIRGGECGLHLSGPRWVFLRDLVFEGAGGNGLNVDDGGSGDTPALHVELSRLVVRDIGPRGNCDGIKLSGVDEVTVQACRIARWGSAGSAIDMVGCHDVTIRDCRVGPARGERANGIQAKGGSRNVLISRCAFIDAGGRGVNIGGSTGRSYFRPPAPGYEARSVSVEDCTFSGSQAAVAFVGCDGAVFRHNVVYRPRRWVLRILQETRGPEFVPCRDGRFELNVVVFRSEELRAAANVGPGTEPGSFRFARNVWYCADEPASTKRHVALPTAEVEGTYGVDPRLVGPEEGDFTFPRLGAMRTAGPR